MRYAILILVCAVGCKKGPAPEQAPAESVPVVVAEAPPPEDPEARRWRWRAVSASGDASVEQAYVKPGACKVTGPDWSAEVCLGEAHDFHFVSAGGARLLVLYSLPKVVDDWRGAKVIGLYDKGQLVTETNAGAIEHDRQKLKFFSSHFAWLRGTNGIGGSRPYYAGDNFVVGTTSSGAQLRVGFDGSGIPAGVAVAAPEARRREGIDCGGGTMEWTDAKGNTGYTDDLQEVPAAFRKRVKCTGGADVAVISGAPSRELRDPRETAVNPDRQEGPPQAAPKSQLTCCTFNFERWKKEPGMTHTGPDAFMTRRVCYTAGMSEGQKLCESERSRQKGSTPCQCSSGKPIGSESED